MQYILLVELVSHFHKPVVISISERHDLLTRWYLSSFDAEANGTFAGNGFGIVVLRRLEDALVDGNTIIAVLRGSAINNDGHTKKRDSQLLRSSRPSFSY